MSTEQATPPPRVLIKPEWVNSVLRALVNAVPKDERMQITVLAVALVFVAKTFGVPKDKLLENIGVTYDEQKVTAIPPRGEPS